MKQNFQFALEKNCYKFAMYKTDLLLEVKWWEISQIEWANYLNHWKRLCFKIHHIYSVHAYIFMHIYTYAYTCSTYVPCHKLQFAPKVTWKCLQSLQYSSSLNLFSFALFLCLVQCDILQTLLKWLFLVDCTYTTATHHI